MDQTVMQLTTPVVLIIFNRPETTERVFSVIRDVRPSRLLVIADGPRVDRPGEKERCLRTRAVLERIDWPCQVEKNYSDVNLGCMRRISSGLDWVFSVVEEAIILEDDCLPDPTFFRFCTELLTHFRDNMSVAQISGVNYQPGHQRSPYSYYFSRYNHCWGWATWRRSWLMNDNAMSAWPAYRDSNGLAQVLPKRREIKYWRRLLDKVALGEVDSWACRWTLSCWRHRLITVLPNVNLVSNIGFGSSATHTIEAQCEYANLPTSEMQFPLIHPLVIETDRKADYYTSRLVFQDLTVYKKIKIVLNNVIAILRGRRE